MVANFATTAADGKNYRVDYYSLAVIMSVGYRVRSHRGAQFRIWATQRLREYLIKGFAMDEERLKAAGGGRYFDELLARIRDIRSSEEVFWLEFAENQALRRRPMTMGDRWLGEQVAEGELSCDSVVNQ